MSSFGLKIVLMVMYSIKFNLVYIQGVPKIMDEIETDDNRGGDLLQ